MAIDTQPEIFNTFTFEPVLPTVLALPPVGPQPGDQEIAGWPSMLRFGSEAPVFDYLTIINGLVTDGPITIGQPPQNAITITPGVDATQPVTIGASAITGLNFVSPVRITLPNSYTTPALEILTSATSAQPLPPIYPFNGAQNVTPIHLVNNGNNANITIDTIGGVPFLNGRAAEGPYPGTATAINRIILGLRAYGFSGMGYSATSRARIQFVAAENYTDASQGAFIRFSTAAIGSSPTIDAIERMRITDDGSTVFGLIGTSNTLTITPGAAASSPISLKPSGTGVIQIDNGSLQIGGATQNKFEIDPGATTSDPIVIWATGTGPIQVGNGKLQVQQGGAASPGLSFISNASTGIYGSGGTFNISCLGVQAMAANSTTTRFFLNMGFNGAAAIAKPTITGSRGGIAAVASLLTALASYGLITDSTTA